MKTLIVGSGGVGSIIAAYLARGGRNVTIADGWSEHIETVKESGITIEAVEGDFNVAVDAIHLDELPSYAKADVIVVASKSYDTRTMSLLAREAMHDETVVMSAQNGMNDATVAGVVGVDQTVACVVAFGADLIGPGRSRRTSAINTGSIVIGHLRPGRSRAQLEELFDHFEPLGGVRIADDVWPERWGKLTLNSMSNALAGLTGLMSNNLWSEPKTLDIIIALGHETASVAAADGVAMAPVLGRIPHGLWLEASSSSKPAWGKIAEHMRGVSAERTGAQANRASLLQDIMKGRRTEIDYLNGWVYRKGLELGVEAPTHAMLVSELYPVQRGRTAPSLINASKMSALVEKIYS